MRVRVSAPGKVMVSGEYGVLSGEPALVMAAHRRVEVVLEAADAWRFVSDGNPEPAPPQDFLTRLEPPRGGVAMALWSVAGALEQCPQPLAIAIDSRALQHAGRKLGLGSSAAVSVALAVGLAHHEGLGQPSMEDCAHAHDRLQGTVGSGFDVAAAVRGGWFEFQRDHAGIRAVGTTTPPAVLRYVWTGKEAKTTGFVARYRAWEQHDPRSRALITALGSATRSALSACHAQSATDFVAAIRESARRLAELAQAADIPIFAGGHAELADLAESWGVSYKPCGAGGGDIGLATAEDESRLVAFIEAVRDEGYHPLQLECDIHGVRVEREATGVADS